MEEYRKKLRNQWGKWKKDAATAAIYVVLSVSCFVCYYLGMAQGQELKTYDSLITFFRLDGNAYSYLEAVQMRMRSQEAEFPFSYALWGNGGIHLLQNPDLQRNAQVEMLVVEGYSDLLLSSDVVLDGTEKKGCLIGEGAAQSLFGVSDAIGLSVRMDGCDYVVLGMLADVKQGAVFHAKDIQACALDRMNVQAFGNVTLSSLEQQVEWELGFAGRALDYRFINSLMGLMGFGLCLLLWMYLLRLMAAELKKYQYENAQKPQCGKIGNPAGPAYVKGLAIRLACMLGVIAALGVFLWFHAKVPEDLIPTKWSDFAFWDRLFHEKSERMLDWAKCEKGAAELLYLGKITRTAVYLALSYLCYAMLRAIQFGRNSVRKTLE